MKKTILYLFILISTAVFSQEKPVVKAAVDTTAIRIGEQFEYKILVNATKDVIIPKLENLKGLEVVESKKLDTLKKQLIKKYIITGFDSGAFYIPQQQIFIRQKLFLTDSLLIHVATVKTDTIKQPLFPIKSIAKEPYRFDDFLPYFWYVLLGLVLIGLLIYYFVKKKKTTDVEEQVPLLAPLDEAIEKLHQLDEKLLWQNNKVKEYYSELTAIVRAYIERQLNIPAMESTTDELVASLFDFNEIKTIDTSKETIAKLKGLLQEADLVKFAKSTPMAEEIETNRKEAEEIVSDLKPKTIEIKTDELE